MSSFLPDAAGGTPGGSTRKASAPSRSRRGDRHAGLLLDQGSLPALPRAGRHLLLAHLLLFFSRLSFIFAGSLLSLSLFRRLTDLEHALPGMLVLLLSAFAQFCYSRELEALARRVEGPSDAAT